MYVFKVVKIIKNIALFTLNEGHRVPRCNTFIMYICTALQTRTSAMEKILPTSLKLQR